MPHRGGGQVAQLTLREIQRVEDGGLPLIRRIARDDLIEFRLVLGSKTERLARLCDLALRPLKPGRNVLHLGMKTHRSQSPITTSLEPMTAITSAIIPPSMIFGSA